MHRLHKLRQLSWQERGWLLLALGILPLNAAAVSLLGLRRWQAVLVYLSPSSHASDSRFALSDASRFADIVAKAAYHGPFRANCLQRSLALWWFLRWQNVESCLCFGVRHAPSGLEAHAWVECDGDIINDRPDIRESYIPLVKAEGLSL